MEKAKTVGRVVLIIITILACVVIAVIPCLGTATGILLTLNDLSHAVHWRESTSPLSPEVAQDICDKFNLGPSDDRCKPNATVSAPDFFRTIGQTFEPANGNWATFDQVEEKIGKYKYKQEPPVRVSQGYTYFVAHYDLRGDRVYPMAAFFYDNGQLFRFIADVGD